MAAVAMKDLHLFVPTYRVDECLAEIRECLESGWTGLGGKTLKFESAWRDYAGLEFAHMTNSGTAALHLALRVLRDADGWEAGDEIITTPLTFVSTNHAIKYCGLTPVFADVDECLCLDPASVESAITARTRAVMFVGLGGNVGRLEEIVTLCILRGLRLILDAAHMAGTRVYGRHVGHQADAACFSFHSVKNLPTADAGMVCFKDGAHDKASRVLSWCGIDKDTFARTGEGGSYAWRYAVESVGFKYHGNSIMAALGLVGLKYLDADNAMRRQIAGWYDELLFSGEIQKVPTAPGCESSRHLYQVRVRDRDAVVAHLQRNGIFPGVHYQVSTSYPMYAATSCPEAERAADELLSLPMHLGLTRADVVRIATTLTEAVTIRSVRKLLSDAMADSSGIVLRRLRAEWLPMTLDWRNHLAVRPGFTTDTFIAYEAHARWYRRYCHETESVWVIHQNDIPVGQIGLSPRQEDDDAEIGRILIIPEAQGLGVAVRAVRLVQSVCLGAGIKRLSLTVKPDNEAALNLYRACGFKEYGRHGDNKNHIIDMEWRG